MSRNEGDDVLLKHTIGVDGHFVVGALAHCTVWGFSMFGGLFSPLIAIAVSYFGSRRAGLSFLFLVISSVALKAKHSSVFCRFYLRAAACTGGATIWIRRDLASYLQGDGVMVCYHPHGVLPLGFSFNGALRAMARMPKAYEPEGFRIPERCKGVLAPVLFHIPFLATVLGLWGAAIPATKHGMKQLLKTRTPFGILVGGSEEVAIHEHGQENVFVNQRAGFVKYALEQGYTLVIAYTFGENDQYHSANWLRPLNLWLVRHFGFVLPCFWGRSWFPILPCGCKGGLNTVFGGMVQLPKIDNPTAEDVGKWHGVYVERLEHLFEQYKERFGYGDRRLKRF